MKQNLKVALILGLLTIILGSALFWVRQLIERRQVMTAAAVTCRAITPYLQIGALRTAQEIARASLLSTEAETGYSVFFPDFAGTVAPFSYACHVPGRQGPQLTLAFARELKTHPARVLLSSLLFMSVALTAIGFAFQLSYRILQLQIDQALRGFFGDKQEEQSLLTSRFLNVPALQSTRQSLQHLTQRVAEETERVTSLNTALERRRAVAKYIHDIRSPIGALGIVLRKRQSLFSEDEQSMLREIVQRLQSIPDHILSIEKSSLKVERNDHTAINSDEIEAVLRLISTRLSLAHPGHVHFEIKFSTEDAAATAGRAQLSAVQLDRLLTNLVENARASGANQIHVVAQPKPESWQILVRDDGPGGLGSELRSPSPMGAGLGLEISREILASSQAKYQVNSPIGAGTEVWIELPLLTS